jgi:hypothetical protein
MLGGMSNFFVVGGGTAAGTGAILFFYKCQKLNTFCYCLIPSRCFIISVSAGHDVLLTFGAAASPSAFGSGCWFGFAAKKNLT